MQADGVVHEIAFKLNSLKVEFKWKFILPALHDSS